MAVKQKEHDLVSRIEFFVRRLFERIGGTFDFALRRAGHSQVAARTDLSALSPQIERAVETSLRQENSSIIAPNLIELRYDYETFVRIGEKRREYLQKELSSSAYEYIYNRRYMTLDDVRVKITYDAFTIGLEIRVNFGEDQGAAMAGGSPDRSLAGGPAKTWKRCDIIMRGMGGYPELRAHVTDTAEPIGIGRNVANQMIIKDPTVSNFHAAFVLRPDGTLELADRGSANGTYVNGVMIGSGERAIVRHEDRLRFGDVEMGLSVRVTEE